MKVVFTLLCFMGSLAGLLSQDKGENLISELEILKNVISTNQYYQTLPSILDSTMPSMTYDWYIRFSNFIKKHPETIGTILSDNTIDDRVKMITLITTKESGPEFFINEMNKAIILVQQKKLNPDVFKYSYHPLFTDFQDLYYLNYKDERIQKLMSNIQIVYKDKDESLSDFASRIKNGKAYEEFIQNRKDHYGANWRTKISTNLLYQPDIIEPEFSPEMLKLIKEAESVKNSNTNNTSTSDQIQTHSVTNQIRGAVTFTPLVSDTESPDLIFGVTKRNLLSALMMAGGGALLVMTLLYAFWPRHK